MDRHLLQTLLDLRQREEDAARTAWAAATERLAKARAEAERLESAAAEAEARLTAARGRHDDGRPGTRASAADAAAEARFLARLLEQAKRSAAGRESFHAGGLAAATAGARAAEQAFHEKRGALEAVRRHEARLEHEERVVSERRADEAHDDHAQTARHHRLRDPKMR